MRWSTTVIYKSDVNDNFCADKMRTIGVFLFTLLFCFFILLIHRTFILFSSFFLPLCLSLCDRKHMLQLFPVSGQASSIYHQYKHRHAHDPAQCLNPWPYFHLPLIPSICPFIQRSSEWSWNIKYASLSVAFMSVTSIQTAADAFWRRAFKAGRRSVYEGTGHAGLGLSSPAVTKLWAQSQKAGLGRRLWCI